MNAPIRVKMHDKCFDPKWRSRDERIALCHGGEECDVELATCFDAKSAPASHLPRILWLQESSSMWPFRRDIELYKTFDLVLTHDKDILEAVPQARYLTLVSTWEWERGPHEKTKMVSAVLSAKNTTVAQQFRHELYGNDEIRSRVDFLGAITGTRLKEKMEGVRPYRFSLALENGTYDWWHTEKLFDCFATKTIPLYHGCRDTEQLRVMGFNPDGILWFDTAKELSAILQKISADYYDMMLPVVEQNYTRIWQKPYVENWLADKICEFMETR